MKKNVRLCRIVLIGIISVVFLVSAYNKFVNNADTFLVLAKSNLSNFRIAFGLIELILVTTLICRPTRKIGIFLMSAYIGGAIAITLSLGGNIIWPVILLLMVWLLKKICSHGKYCGCTNCETENCKMCKVGSKCDRHNHSEFKKMCKCTPECKCEEGKCNC